MVTPQLNADNCLVLVFRLHNLLHSSMVYAVVSGIRATSSSYHVQIVCKVRGPLERVQRRSTECEKERMNGNYVRGAKVYIGQIVSDITVKLLLVWRRCYLERCQKSTT